METIFGSYPGNNNDVIETITFDKHRNSVACLRAASLSCCPRTTRVRFPSGVTRNIVVNSVSHYSEVSASTDMHGVSFSSAISGEIESIDIEQAQDGCAGAPIQIKLCMQTSGGTGTSSACTADREQPIDAI